MNGARLDGKVVIVTGASSGSGIAIAEAMAAAGAHVVASGRDAERLDDTVRRIVSAGGSATGVAVDLADDDAGERLAQAALDAHGRVHVIVSNAASFLPASLEDTTPELVDTQWRVNVRTPLFLVKAAAPHMPRGSAIVFVTSTTALVGFSGYSAYTATKGAGEAMARALAVELAPRGIRVNAVAPGFVRTPMLQPALDADPDLERFLVERTPAGRLGAPSDVAEAVMYLASDRAAYVLGASLVVDGGWVVL